MQNSVSDIPAADMPASDAAASSPIAPDARLGDLAEIIQAYNEVTDKVQRSHEGLQNEVLRLREELASTNAKLQRSKRLSALGEMAAGIAHEIRNPLAAIQLYAEMVAEDAKAAGPDMAMAAENATKIATAVVGLNGIVGDVLSFAREVAPEPQLLDVQEVFCRAIEAHRPALDAAGVEVVVDPGMPQDLTLLADPGLIQQTLLNLVRNAADAMDGIDGERTLSLSASSEDGFVALRIADSGPGIPDEQIDRIFNPFFTTRSTGTGLGLAIVHRIVDAHGGSISVSNDGGAAFEISLPEQASVVSAPAPSGAPSVERQRADEVQLEPVNEGASR